MKRFIAVAAASLLLPLAAACSSSGGSTSSSAASDTSPIKYFVLLPESGPFATYALGYRQGIQASVDVVNSEGGILGRHVDVTFADDTGTASEAVLKLQQAEASGTINLLGAGILEHRGHGALPAVDALQDHHPYLSIGELAEQPVRLPLRFRRRG